MTHRHTLLFGTVLAVAGAAIAADHLAHSTPDAALPSAPAPALAPASAPADESAIIEFAPCSANTDGLMASPAPQPAPAPAAVPAPTPDPAIEPAEEPAIIEFAPCAAAF